MQTWSQYRALISVNRIKAKEPEHFRSYFARAVAGAVLPFNEEPEIAGPGAEFFNLDMSEPLLFPPPFGNGLWVIIR